MLGRPFLSSAFLGLAQGFFLQTAGALAALQLGHHLRGCQAVVRQRNHGVKPQICHFIEDLALVRAMIDILLRRRQNNPLLPKQQYNGNSRRQSRQIRRREKRGKRKLSLRKVCAR